jgi:hypothetical protein
MPPQRLVFEGPTPESVILDACSEHGTQVQLTEPERFRRGGVMGFFARSGYRVRVMPGAAASAPLASSPAAALQTTADALGHLDDELDAYLDSAPDVSVEISSPEPISFDRALERAVNALGPDPAGTLPSAFEAIVANLTAEAVAALQDPAPVPQVSSLDALRRGVEAEDGATMTAPITETVRRREPAPERSDAAIPAAEQLSAQMNEAPIDPLAPYRAAALRGEAIGGSMDEDDFSPAAFLAPPATPEPVRQPVSAQQTIEVAAKLRSVGFPNRALTAAASRLPAGFTLEQVFSTLPQSRAIPRVPGALIAVIGIEEAAMSFARKIASELEVSPDDVALARTTGPGGISDADELGFSPDLLVESAEQAAALAPGWRRDRVAVVAVSVPPTLSGAARARTLLRSLRPSITLLLADASTKAADIHLRAEALGGVDSLIMHNVRSTSTPAEMVATEIAVARIEHESATPTLWARLVEDSLDERAGGERR